MAAIKFYLENRKDKTENLVIVVKYSFHGQRLEYPTGVRINKAHYNIKCLTGKVDPVKASAPEAEDKNQKLNIIKGHIQTAENFAANNGTPLTVSYFREYLNNKLKAKSQEERPVTFFEYCDKFITGKKLATNSKTGRPLSHANVEKYSATKSMLMEFAKHRGKPINFQDFDEKLYHELVNYMVTEKKYALNTSGRAVKFLKTILHQAVEEGHSVNMKYQKAFKGQTEPSDNAYLTETELDTIYKHDFSKRPGLDRVRDLFLIGCWTGLRFRDYTNLKRENIQGNQIKVIQHKTSDEVIIPLHPVVKAILEKYDYQLPPPISNQKFNDYVQDVCEACKINDQFTKNITRAGKTEITSKPKWEFITSHSARRSFATNAYKRKVSPVLIMSVTGHKSESEFFKYIKLSNSEKAELFKTQAQW